MVTPNANEKLSELLLEHIGRYRISFLKVMEKVYGGQGAVAGAVQALEEANLIKPLGKKEGFGSALANHTAYQLTTTGAARIGITERRAKKLTENTLEPSFRVLWLCCMGEERFARLGEAQLKELFNSPLGAKCNNYCIEIGGNRRVYRIRLLSAESTDERILRETRKDLLECAEVPILKDFVEHGRYGNLLVVSKPERCKRLEERISKQGLRNLGQVRVALVPDLNGIGGAFRAR